MAWFPSSMQPPSAAMPRTEPCTQAPELMPASLQVLKHRLLPICHRTLRRQVQEAGHFSFTARNAVTFDFEPRDDEAKLYFQVSEFLKRKDTVSYGDRTNQLVILQVRKILGSSTFAVSRYLENLIVRLESKTPVDETVTDDIDAIDELAEEFDEDAEQDEAEGDRRCQAGGGD